MFTEAFVSEFLVLDDYVQYLSDDYESLSMLMRLLLSLSSVLECPNRSNDAVARASACDRRAAEWMYSVEERRKLAYLIDRCGIQQIQVCHDDTRGVSAAELEPKDAVTGETVLAAWREALLAAATARGAEFSRLEYEYAASEHLVHGQDECVEPSDKAVAMNTVEKSCDGSEALSTALPMLAVDDLVAFPPTPLSGDRAKTIALKDLFKRGGDAS